MGEGEASDGGRPSATTVVGWLPHPSLGMVMTWQGIVELVLRIAGVVSLFNSIAPGSLAGMAVIQED